MNPCAIAVSRTARMPDRDGSDFMAAYYRALAVCRTGRDLEEMWTAAWCDRATSAATLAGLLEGIAAARGGAR
ncbi:hypothetical protein JJV70_15295 [Streptomyces sp. JJ66]|uniref:hypothetical protein n=1 Tax=Streptomyces sp. JJ66 TaxID=2803843 RepID=UPI001C5A48C7|nr:hypothetical protein [Streptomyces sp. JJ66]MBW1603445.1 hypothetical protein [Streptomyces sp. JJ66]